MNLDSCSTVNSMFPAALIFNAFYFARLSVQFTQIRKIGERQKIIMAQAIDEIRSNALTEYFLGHVKSGLILSLVFKTINTR